MNKDELESLKRELCDKFSETSIEDSVIYACIDHLAPRIVREGFAVVPEEPTAQMIADGALAYVNFDKSEGRMKRAFKAMIAASKGD